MASEVAYVRYYVGHKGKFGHEFLEFEFQPNGAFHSLDFRDISRITRGMCAGQLRYANNSNYKNDVMIRKECFVAKPILQELRRIVEDSEIMQEDDSSWPQPDRVGRQELEIQLGNEHISFATTKIGSLMDVNQSKCVV